MTWIIHLAGSVSLHIILNKAYVTIWIPDNSDRASCYVLFGFGEGNFPPMAQSPRFTSSITTQVR